MGPGAPVPLSPLSLSHLEFLTLPSPGRRPSPHTRKETSLATLWWPAEQPCTMRQAGNTRVLAPSPEGE